MNKDNKNSGFSLVELIIAIAVLAFLMLAVSSFMGSSVSQTRKEQVDVKLQTQAQETYSLITDTIMQANDIVMVGYTASEQLNFATVGEETSATMAKKFYVKDEATAKALVKDPSLYGITDSVSKALVIFLTQSVRHVVKRVMRQSVRRYRKERHITARVILIRVFSSYLLRIIYH